MELYDVLCLVICVFAVFGGYIALRIAACAALRRCSRRAGCERTGCENCPDADDCQRNCPEKGTAGAEAAKRD